MSACVSPARGTVCGLVACFIAVALLGGVSAQAAQYPTHDCSGHWTFSWSMSVFDVSGYWHEDDLEMLVEQDPSGKISGWADLYIPDLGEWVHCDISGKVGYKQNVMTFNMKITTSFVYCGYRIRITVIQDGIIYDDGYALYFDGTVCVKVQVGGYSDSYCEYVYFEIPGHETQLWEVQFDLDQDVRGQITGSGDATIIGAGYYIASAKGKTAGDKVGLSLSLEGPGRSKLRAKLTGTIENDVCSGVLDITTKLGGKWSLPFSKPLGQLPAERSVSGQVMDASGIGLDDVRVVISSDGQGKHTTTQNGGLFSIHELAMGKYSVSAYKTGYTFTPPAKRLNISYYDIVGVNFKGRKSDDAYMIYGYITDSQGNAVSRVTVDFSDGLRSARTDNNGYYETSVTDPGIYTVTPSARGRTFAPACADAEICDTSVRVDFRADGGPPPGASLRKITIQGPSWVNEGEQATYTCLAEYSDKTTSTVIPDWSVDGAAATIDAGGTLSAGQVAKTTRCRVTATYSENGTTKTAKATVSIQDMGQSPVARVKCIRAVDARSLGRWSTTELQMVADDGIRQSDLTAEKPSEDSGLPWGNGEPSWKGKGLASTQGATNTWSDSRATKSKISASGGGCKREVLIVTVRNAEYSKTFSSKSKQIEPLVKIIRKGVQFVGGNPKDVYCDLSGGFLTETVDMYNNPLCGQKWVVNLDGNAGISHRFYIPSLSVNLLGVVKIGVYAEPDFGLSAYISEAGYDPSLSYPWVASGGAEINGLVSLGVEATVDSGSDQFVVSAWGQATAGVSAVMELEVVDESPCLYGQVNVGCADLAAQAIVRLFGYEILDVSWQFHVWDGVDIPEAPAVLFDFATMK